jgi:hypothetical protein
MVSVKDAVESSRLFAIGALGQERTAGLQLEEVELGKYLDRDAWKITLSMLRPNPFAGVDKLKEALSGIASPYAPRDYKSFLVDRETGEVLSMKIRELAGVE